MIPFYSSDKIKAFFSNAAQLKRLAGTVKSIRKPVMNDVRYLKRFDYVLSHCNQSR